MAYSKHEWINGETITAEKLDRIECGVNCLHNCACMWVNPSPTAAFPAQSISLDTSSCNRLELIFITEDGGGWQNVSVILDKAKSYSPDGKWRFRVKYGNYERFVTVEQAQISFSDCEYGISYNGKLIPYGIHAFEG